MNSQERHEARYQRRKARREQRAREAGGASFEEVMSFGNICKAGKSCCDGARWKTSTINFETNLLGEAQATYDTLHYGKRVFKGFHSFATVEHGKVRNIDALPIQERAIQKCLCKNLLTEVYSRSFIYDNSASLKDRGMDFQLRRLRKHLQDHYRRYGTEGRYLPVRLQELFREPAARGDQAAGAEEDHGRPVIHIVLRLCG